MVAALALYAFLPSSTSAMASPSSTSAMASSSSTSAMASPAPLSPVAVDYARPSSVNSGPRSPADTFATPLSSPTFVPDELPPSTSNAYEKPLPPIQHSPPQKPEKPLPPIVHDSPVQDAHSLSSERHASPLHDPPASDSTALTPLRAHYLKKELISLQFQHELNALTDVPTNNISPFSYLGPPFVPLPKGAPALELPFLRYSFRSFVLSFPFLADAPRDFFPDKLQPFLGSMLSRTLSSTSVLDEGDQDGDEAARHKLFAKLERHAAMLMTSGTKLQEKEEVVRLKQVDLDRLEKIARKRAAKEARTKDRFEVNVVCVRTVTEKGRVRSRMHEVRTLHYTIQLVSPHTKIRRNSSSAQVGHTNLMSSYRGGMATSRHSQTSCGKPTQESPFLHHHPRIALP